MSLGYTLILTVIAVIREPLGFGTLLGYRMMPEGFIPWTIMIMAPGAFFTLGLITWFLRAYFPRTAGDSK